MKRFCIFDVSNLIYRVAMAKKASGGSIDDMVNLALATSIRSMKIPFEHFKATHAVMCFDHSSWRKKIFSGYKGSRVQAAIDNPDPVRDKIGMALDDFYTFLKESTNCTVLKLRGCEADDLIARWVEMHPQDQNLIVSSDSDFKQLISSNVSLFNGTTGKMYTNDGVYLNDGTKPSKSDQTKVINGALWRVCMDEDGNPEKIDPQWALFKKIMDGDKSDDVPRASPLRTKTKLLEEIYQHWGGIAWTNFMTTKREDLEGQPTVAEVYERGQLLIDLKMIPDEIKAEADAHIKESIIQEPKRSLGMKFIMFCRARQMIALGTDAERYVPMLSTRYSDDAVA